MDLNDSKLHALFPEFLALKCLFTPVNGIIAHILACKDALRLFGRFLLWD
jgi:hypothetical protein